MTDKLFFLDQHGCAKNQVDGELVIEKLSSLGWTRTSEPEKASLIFINTCGFIEAAKKESLDSLMRARRDYPSAKIILGGCLAERYAEIFRESLPEADAIFGNGNLSKLGDLLEELFGNEKELPVVVKPEQQGVCCGPRSDFLGFKGSAYVKITEGCNNCCSFCAIPLIRGELRSRKDTDIIEEIKSLIKQGFFEINLIGQDLAAYGRDGIERGCSGAPGYFEEPSPLAELLRKISAIEGNFWVRILYIHPDHFPKDILPVIEKDSRILPYFDIPFQSGSSEILKKMNRSGNSESYKELAASIRQKLPEAVIRTTFLCGFPGESEENALQTEAFLREITPDWSGCFSYSREEDTPAYFMKKQVPHKKAEARAERLRSIQAEITKERLLRHKDRIYDAIVEEVIDDPENDAGLAIGRVWFQAPEVDGSCVIRYNLADPAEKARIKEGSVVKVRVLGTSDIDLDSVLI